MNLKVQRRMAADVLKCGVNRVRFNFPKGMTDEEIDTITNAITKADIRELAERGYITKAPEQGTSRGRAKRRIARRQYGRGRGPGSREGAKHARDPRKQRWIAKVRALRESLRELKDTGKITRQVYRQYYLKVKGGMFKSRANLISHLTTTGELVQEAK
jgi:large subunit ribosomal protein L19e